MDPACSGTARRVCAVGRRRIHSPPARCRLPAGRIVVDRAAFDPVESSPMAFELASELLAIVRHAILMGREVEQPARAAIEAWP